MCKLVFVLALSASLSQGRRQRGFVSPDAERWTSHAVAAHKSQASAESRESQLAALLLTLRHPAAAWKVSGLGLPSANTRLPSALSPARLHSQISGSRVAPVQGNVFGDFLDGDKLKAQEPYERPLMPSLVKNAPATYQLQEKLFSWSGEDFKVCDITGEEVIQISGANVNLGGMVIDKLTFKDKSGTKMFSVERRIVAASTCYDIYSADGSTLLAKIEREWLSMTPKYQFYYEGDDNPFGDFFAEGSFSDRQYTFKKGGGFETIAKVRRAPEVVNDVDNYAVDVAAGVDAAAILAIAVVIDEDHDEEDAKRKREGREEEAKEEEGSGWPFR